MTSFVRIVLILLFALFWGGLTFYTGIVVRVIHSNVNDPMDGGLITQQVTLYLQHLATATLMAMFVNAVLVVKQSRRYGIALLVCCTLLACAVAGLYFVHGQLDSVIDRGNAAILDREVFTINHRRYNQFTTLEWISSILYLPLTIVAWRQRDRCVDDSTVKLEPISDSIT